MRHEDFPPLGPDHESIPRFSRTDGEPECRPVSADEHYRNGLRDAIEAVDGGCTRPGLFISDDEIQRRGCDT